MSIFETYTEGMAGHASRWIQIFPKDTHKAWGEILHAGERGIIVKITRIKVKTGFGGYTPELNETYFYSWNNLQFKYANEDEATAESWLGHGK